MDSVAPPPKNRSKKTVAKSCNVRRKSRFGGDSNMRCFLWHQLFTIMAWLCFLVLFSSILSFWNRHSSSNPLVDAFYVGDVFLRLFYAFWCRQNSFGLTAQHFTTFACLPDFSYFQDSEYIMVLTRSVKISFMSFVKKKQWGWEFSCSVWPLYFYLWFLRLNGSHWNWDMDMKPYSTENSTKWAFRQFLLEVRISNRSRDIIF